MMQELLCCHASGWIRIQQALNDILHRMTCALPDLGGVEQPGVIQDQLLYQFICKAEGVHEQPLTGMQKQCSQQQSMTGRQEQHRRLSVVNNNVIMH